METRDTDGRFIRGKRAANTAPVGTVRLRTRRRDGQSPETRAFVKIAEPSSWELRARVVWEESNGPIPRGMGIHHKDGDKLNDTLSNLEMVSKAEHLAIHYAEYKPKIVEKLMTERRARRWSTKSQTKRTGAPPSWKTAQMRKALAEYLTSGETVKILAERHGIPYATLRKKTAALEELL